MFSVEQKRSIADKVQQILRDTNHPELPREEIQFSLHVDGAASWSWADIQNNGNVLNPSVNPWNEAQDKADPQHGRDVKPDTCGYPEYRVNVGCVGCPYDCQNKVKPLAQYLGEYIEYEMIDNADCDTWVALLEQALDAYQSTENVKIRIEPV